MCDLDNCTSDPSALLELCQNHVVRCLVNRPQFGELALGIVEERDYPVTRHTKRLIATRQDACKLFTIFEPKFKPKLVPAATLFTAYWCGYKPDSLQPLVCGKYHRLMFTARMDGCTFGIAGAAPNGSRLVCHKNVKVNLNRRGQGWNDR